MDERISAWLIADRGAEAGALETLPDTEGLSVIEPAALPSAKPSFAATEKLAITSEAAIETVLAAARLDERPATRHRHPQGQDRLPRARSGRCFPELYFEEVPIAELARVGARFRPVAMRSSRRRDASAAACGSSSGDVELERLLRSEIEQVSSSAERRHSLGRPCSRRTALIVEEYIPGEEYAVDMFYDASGRPVITNAYHHPMPANPAYLHMVYYSSREVVEQVYEPAMEFFTRLNEILQVRNLPIHSEFRRDGGRLVPIELNSLRFGGMGLANLGHVSLGVNAYRCLIEDRGPDLPALWRDRGEECVLFFIAYNGAGIDVSTHEPNRDALRARFTRILHEVPFDHRRQLAFGVVYAEEPADRLPELLRTEFDELFVPI